MVLATADIAGSVHLVGGTPRGNTFHLWEGVRGWVKPPHVTPHYWTAGEILALQVEHAGFVDESQSEPELVIGGGVPKSWVNKPMYVRRLPTSLGVVTGPGRMEKCK